MLKFTKQSGLRRKRRGNSNTANGKTGAKRKLMYPSNDKFV